MKVFISGCIHNCEQRSGERAGGGGDGRDEDVSRRVWWSEWRSHAGGLTSVRGAGGAGGGGAAVCLPLDVVLSMSSWSTAILRMSTCWRRSCRSCSSATSSADTPVNHTHYRHSLADTSEPQWLGSRVVSVLDSGAEGPGFKSQPRRCPVAVLGKLFTPVVPLFTKQRNW